VSVQNPQAGTWKAYVFTRVVGSTAYKGPVQLTVDSSKTAPAGTVTPASMQLAKGQTGTFTLHTQIPTQTGDTTDQIQISGNWAGGGAIPVILRSLIPATTSTPGAFSGTLTGGNGRGGPGQTLTYEFNVPSGVQNVALNVALTDPNYNLLGFLVSPEGFGLDTQTTVSAVDKNGAATAYGKTMQFFWRNPEAGHWRFLLEVNYNISGGQTSIPLTGTLRYNTVTVTARTLPNSSGTHLASGKAVVVPVHITNNGNTTKNYFVDARLTQMEQLYLGSVSNIAVPGTGLYLTVVPPETSSVFVAAQSLTSVPINFDVFPWLGDPDVIGTPGFNIYGHPSAQATVTGSEVTPGVWGVAPVVIGPTPHGNATPTTVDIGGLATTQTFDSQVTSTTGDQWANWVGASSAAYKPLTLAPGASGTINVTVTPSGSDGTAVTGNLYVDSAPVPDFSTQVGWYTFQGGDEVAALPYTYTIGAS